MRKLYLIFMGVIVPVICLLGQSTNCDDYAILSDPVLQNSNGTAFFCIPAESDSLHLVLDVTNNPAVDPTNQIIWTLFDGNSIDTFSYSTYTPFDKKLPNGAYRISVRFKAGGEDCEKYFPNNDPTQTFLVTQPQIILDTIQHDSCATGLGSISIGLGGSNMIQWSNGESNTLMIDSLSHGSYTVTVTENSGFKCANVDTFEVECELPFDTAISHVQCLGETNGKVEILNLGCDDLQPFTFSWVDEDNMPISGDSVIQNLAAGTYYVTISDANTSCEKALTFEVLAPGSALVVTSTITNAQCGGDGRIELMVSGGAGNYSYNWMNDSGMHIQGGSVIQNLTAGNYNVTVTDGNGCSQVDTIVVGGNSNPLQVILNLAETTNVSCAGGNDGKVAVSVSGGTPNYDYMWSNTATTPEINNLTSGMYSVTVTDQNGCVDSLTHEVTEPDIRIEEPPFVIDVLCHGNSTGQIQIELVGNDAGSVTEIEWFDVSGDSVVPGNATISPNVPAGVYNVTVTYNNDQCSLMRDDIVISEPSQLVFGNDAIITDVRCNGEQNGSIMAGTVSGGTGDPADFNWVWSDGVNTIIQQGQDVREIGSLSAGDYFLSVMDDNGCELRDTFMVSQPDSITLVINTTQPVDCDGTGSIEFSIKGGTGTPYMIQVGDSTFVCQNNCNSFLVDNIPQGGYSFVVTDGLGCQSSPVEETIRSFDAPEISIVSIDSTDCDKETGAITIQINSKNDPVMVMVNNISVATIPVNPLVGATYEIQNLGPGTYSLKVIDNVKCSSITLMEEVFEKEKPSFDSIRIMNTICGPANGEIEIIGGSSDYEYTWENENGNPLSPTTPTLATMLQPGAYSIRIYDETTNCSIDTSLDVEALPLEDVILLFPVSTEPVCQGESLIYSINIVGGVDGDWSFRWQTSNGIFTTQTIQLNTINLLGSYKDSVIVSANGIDGCGLTKTFSYFVKEKPQPIGYTSSLCNGGSVTLESSNPLPPGATCKWREVNAPTVISSNCAYTTFDPGVFLLEATLNGCEGDAEFQVNDIGDLPAIQDIVDKSFGSSTLQNHILIYPEAGLCYQWGYYDDAGMEVEDPLDNQQHWYLDEDYVPGRTYYVKISLKDVNGDCHPDCDTLIARELQENPEQGRDWQLQVRPNPSNGQFNVFVSQPEPEPLKLRLYNSLGSLVLETQDIQAASIINKRIDAPNLSSGFYYLQVLQAEGGKLLDQRILIIAH